MRRAGIHFSRLGLQHKFILITACSIIFVMSVVGYVGVKREKSILYAEVEKQGRLLGETLAIPIINDLIYERLGVIEEGGLLDNYILEISSRKDLYLLYMAILDDNGKVISHNDITEYGKIYSDPLTRVSLDAESTVVQQYSRNGHNIMDFGVPLSIGKKRWGTLKFGISLEKVEAEVMATVAKIIILTIVLIVAGFVVVILLSRRFLMPITQLANTMDKAGGNYLDVKVDIKGHDELAVLGERFNSMIDRIRLANEELRKTHEKMVQSEKLASIGILAAGVAHEINNPLGGLCNCLEILKRDDNPESREKYMELAKEGLERIESTVRKLLWMARKSEHVPSEVDINSVVNSVRSFLEFRLVRGRIAFKSEIPEGLHVFVDPHDIQQLLLNLFINAIQAMKEGGLLTVRAYKEESLVRIEVKDNGCGISQEDIGRIFDPFFTTKSPGEGTGLGLWLTYEILRTYGGDVLVQSELGKGSSFTLSFPENKAK